jgi:hypothetical protein
MGYRSNIEVLCGSKVYQELHAVMTRHNWHPDSIKKVPNHDVYFIELCGYKWYDSYTDVQEFMEVLEDCANHEKDPRFFYSFIRLGEEREDIETIENHDWDAPYNDHYPYVTTERPLLEPIDELI